MMETVKEINGKMIEAEIKTAITNGKYKNFDELESKNKNITEFCLNHKLEPIIRSFSTQFTNNDYIQLIERLKKEKQFEQNNGEIKETKINDFVFYEKKDETSRDTLVGFDEIGHTNNALESFEQEKKSEKRVASFIKFTEINPFEMNLSSEEMKIYSSIMLEPEPSKFEIYFDENGKMSNIIRDSEDYYTVEIKDGNVMLNKQDSNQKGNSNSNTKTNAKVMTLSNGKNISSGFTNILILSFVIGSFFGIIFLAIYSKIMN